MDSSVGEQATGEAGEGRLGALVARVREAVLAGPGVTQPAVRRAVEERAAAMSGRIRGSGGEVGPIPADLSEFVDRVAVAAWRVTGEEVAALLEAGYTQDEVFEVTVSAAMGSACGRLERGLAALRGEV
jgi:alkylhydroperoxidase family enzyme